MSLVERLLLAVVASTLLAGLVWLVDRIVHKVSLKWAARLDEFWKIF